jgi:poly(A) polymerase
MSDLTPRKPHRPLVWPAAVLDLAELLAESTTPVYAVGGSVRDAWFGSPLHDLDLATPDGASALARRIADALRGDVYVMDAERDVARVLADTPDGRLSLDIAAFRAEDLLGDLTERDFTVNAMAVDLREPLLLIDPLNGEKDLRDRVIRRCSAHAIEHDPIRALRAVRQSVQLKARIEPATLADIRANAAGLSRVSPERTRDEFVKLIVGPRPAAALRIVRTLGLLSPILPDVAALSDDGYDYTLQLLNNAASLLTVISPSRNDNSAAAFALGAFVVALDRFRGELQSHFNQRWANERPHRAILFIASLFCAVTIQHPSQYAKAIAERLRLSNPETARLAALLGADYSMLATDRALSILEQHRFWHRLGAAGVDVVILSIARTLTDYGLEIAHDNWVTTLARARALLDAYFSNHAAVVAPPPFVDGTLIMKALNLKPGPLVREVLDAIREGQVAGVVTDAESAVVLAREYLQRKGQA